MKTPRTPQEKKRLSYERDCRNTYGQYHKASIRRIRLRKRWVNQSYRSTVRHELQQLHSTELEACDTVMSRVYEVQRKKWKKQPDTPLGEYLRRRRERKSWRTSSLHI